MDGHVNLQWSICDTNGFRHYSVVRSTDGEPSWPVGAGDTLLANLDDIDIVDFVDATRRPVPRSRIACSRSRIRSM